MVLGNKILFHHIVQLPSITLPDNVHGNSDFTDIIYDTFIYHVSNDSYEQTEPVGEEMFDYLCSIELRFYAPMKFEHQSLKTHFLGNFITFICKSSLEGLLARRC